MPTESPAAPAAPAIPATPVKPVSAAPVPPAATIKPSTPAIPPAQAASVRQPPPAPAPAVKSDDGKSVPESLQANLRKAMEQVTNPTPPPVEAKATPEAKPEVKPVEAPKAAEKKKSTVFDAVAPEKEAKPAVEAEKDPFEHITPPEGMSEKSLTGWKALKTEAAAKVRSAEQKLLDAQSQLDTYRKATPAEQADVAKLKADLQSAHDRLAVLDITQHPDFARQFIEPKKKALTNASTLLTDNGVADSPDLTGLLLKPRAEFAKAVSEMVAKMPVYDQAEFTTNMREAYRLQGEEKGALAQAGDLSQKLQAQTAQKQKQAFEDVYATFHEKMRPLEIPDNANTEERAQLQEFNDALAQIRPAAEKYAFGRIDEKGVADLASRAASGDFIVRHAVPRMQREFAKAQQLVAELTEELTAIKGAKNPGSFSADKDGAPADLSKGTLRDAMKEAERLTAAGQRL